MRAELQGMNPLNMAREIHGLWITRRDLLGYDMTLATELN
jgi:hypothetical protein